MFDPTEDARRAMVHEINSRLSPDEQVRYGELILQYGEDNVWDTPELEENFEVTGFLAPFCIVRRKSDNVKGLLQFCHSPRFYFDFTPS
jgi:hypothetical protein